LPHFTDPIPFFFEGVPQIAGAVGKSAKTCFSTFSTHFGRVEDIRGILHAHTDSSDGVDALADMAEATCERGYQYFGVADHSRSAHYAGGLSLNRSPPNTMRSTD
jgi:DNA polymerase (family 10)